MGARRQVPATSRIAAIAALLAYGVCALGSGADRLSAEDSVLAANVPAPFAGTALRTLGTQALAQGNAVEAAAIGSRAIAAAPTDPQSTALYAAGKLGAGQRAVADRAFRVAGQLGWRVPITQTYWMGEALKAGRYDLAALRLDALLRQQPQLLDQRQLIDPMERNPAGEAAMVARMRLKPVWLANYTGGGVENIPADVALQRADVMQLAARNGLIVGCDGIDPLTMRLATVGQFETGSKLYRQHCPAAGHGLVADPALQTLTIAARPSAFGWSLAGNSELAVVLLPSSAGAGQRLVIDGANQLPRTVLTQNIVAAPGRYVLRWRSGDAGGRVMASLGCSGQPPEWSEGQRTGPAGQWQANVQSPAGCKLVQLSIGVAPGTGPTWLERVELVPGS